MQAQKRSQMISHLLRFLKKTHTPGYSHVTRKSVWRFLAEAYHLSVILRKLVLRNHASTAQARSLT